MPGQKKKAQEDLFTASTSWFHIFKAMIDSGDVAKLGPYATTCYLVIKAHTNFSTGRAFPSIETIVEKSGISDSKVREAINELVKLGYIKKKRAGRQNIYTLREKIEIADGDGRPAAVATFDYLPGMVREAMAEIKDVLVTGDFAGAKIVMIERLVMNIAKGPGPQSNVNFLAEVNHLAENNRDLAKSIQSAVEANKKRKS